MYVLGICTCVYVCRGSVYMVYACLAEGMCTWYMRVWFGVCVHGIYMFGWRYVYMVYACLVGGLYMLGMC